VARFPGLHLYTAQGGGGLSNGSDKSTDQHLGGRPSIPSSAASSAAQSSASYGQAPLQIGGRGTPDPSSAISVYSEGGTTAAGGMERQGSSMGVTNGIGEHVLPDLSKLRLDKGRDLDVDDLDDDGWMAASKDGMIEELGTLGEGAGGAVTKCRLKGGKTVFALKIITADPDPDMQKQIRRELQFNQKIAEAHICRYYGAYGDSSSGIISIVMEYCEGGSLDVVYKEVKKLGGRIGEKVLGKIAEGVLDGLTYLYKQKIIHRGAFYSTLTVPTLHSCPYLFRLVLTALQQTSSPRTSYYAATARLSSATSASVASSALAATRTPSLGPHTTWHRSGSQANRTTSTRTFGLWECRCSKSHSIASPSLLMAGSWTRAAAVAAPG